MEAWIKERKTIDGCGKGYIEERAYLSTITRAFISRSRAHSRVGVVVVS
jgi:hypothetical protein